MRKWLVVTMLYLLAVATTQAKDVKLGDVTLKLTPPDGYCELDPDSKTDKSFYQTSKATIAGIGNELLFLIGECGELRSWRAGKTPLRWFVSYQTPKDRLTTSFAPKDAKEACDDIRARGQKIGDEQKGGMESAVRAASKDNAFLGVKVLGVLEDDAVGCYIGLVTRSKVGKDTFVQLKVIFAGSIKDRAVYSYLEKPYQEGDANIQMLLGEAKRHTKLLKAANGL
ncbi:MAG: hypothetical protein JO000_21740 [Alphaproteobacteria bacterium]|nr:hypothetical protein [Alphaproteobacteria bacterium]